MQLFPLSCSVSASRLKNGDKSSLALSLKMTMLNIKITWSGKVLHCSARGCCRNRDSKSRRCSCLGRVNLSCQCWSRLRRFLNISVWVGNDITSLYSSWAESSRRAWFGVWLPVPAWEWEGGALVGTYLNSGIPWEQQAGNSSSYLQSSITPHQGTSPLSSAEPVWKGSGPCVKWSGILWGGDGPAQGAGSSRGEPAVHQAGCWVTLWVPHPLEGSTMTNCPGFSELSGPRTQQGVAKGLNLLIRHQFLSLV